jgi:bifunctional non-homologous end joining protein LigD
MALDAYKKKRDFRKTPEPSGTLKKSGKQLIFVVQKHDASHLHYDFRLEMDGVLKSWAVPKGPSMDPSVTRLAMQVEDHPYSYRDFEGVIPEGEYGGGEVIVWDAGVYAAEGGMKALRAGLHSGKLKFTMLGTKLKGAFALIRTKTDEEGRAQWLLKKDRDEYASKEDIMNDTVSVLSGAQLSRDGGAAFSGSFKAKRSAKRGGDKKAAKEKRGSARIGPEYLSPMLATLVNECFDDPDWIFEVKWDGYRIMARLSGGDAALYSRGRIDMTKKYPHTADALRHIAEAHDAVIDGELVALDAEGRPRFQLMQQPRADTPLVYYAFDLLYLDGEDLRGEPLVKRKERLEALLPDIPLIRYSTHVQMQGKKFFRAAKAQKLEGVMAKRADSPYRSGKRSDDWLKVKVDMRQEAVIIGYTEPRGSRSGFGALILAVRDGERWKYIGHTGTGFGRNGHDELHRKMQPLIRKTSVIKERVPVNQPPTWLTPKLVCEVKFTEWTTDGSMRHPVYMGLRTDKVPTEVVREVEQPLADKRERSTKPGAKAAVGKVEYSNLDKVYFPTDGYTKGDVIAYYERMADTIFPYLAGRPIVLNRFPNGIDKPSFYQKDTVARNLPDYVKTTSIYSESNDKHITYIVCENKETILYLANLACIDMNPWNSRADRLDRPDWYVIDLDPGDNTFEEVIEVAKVVREVLELSCEESYVKTSGKTGLHIYVPLAGAYTYDQVRPFAELVVRLVHERIPAITSLERSPAKRKKKIYLDWLQNRYGQTLASPYSIRPTAGAFVSAPLTWQEVRKGLSPSKFTIENMERRLKTKGDLFTPVLGKGVDLGKALVCIREELATSPANKAL